MKRILVPLLASLLATFALAASDVEAQKPGSAKPAQAAEAAHLKKQHGLKKDPNQVEAQAQGSAKAQAVAEARKAKKPRGKLNDSADERLEKKHPNH